MSILAGSLYLGQDISWQGEHVLPDLCLYTDESTEQSPVFDVNFHLEAIIHLTAVKLFMLKRDRWRASVLEPDSGLNRFLRQLFNEETNLCGTTKKALLVQVDRKADIKPGRGGGRGVPYPLPSKSNMIVYGERRDTSLIIYAHPFFDDFDFLPVYEASSTLYPPHDDLKNDQMVLDDIFGDAYSFDYENIVQSAQLALPSNRLTEIEMISKIAVKREDQVTSRDLITEAKNAAQEKHRLLKSKNQSNRMFKSKPSKYKPLSVTASPAPTSASATPITTGMPPNESITPEIKIMIKNLIKETLDAPVKENKNINSLIYTSIRYIYRNTMLSSSPNDQARLKCIIKMHVDLYKTADNVVDLFYLNSEEL